MSEIAKVVVVGAGTMGHGIAQVCAQSGLRVTLTDVSEGAVAKGVSAIDKSLERMVQKGKLAAEARERARAAIATSTDPAGASADADLVIEAVPENMALKLDLFRAISARAPSHTIFGTNTSSLSVTEIAGATNDAARVIGLHFFNPVPVMELLEIVRGLGTSDATTDAARAFASRIGKRPIVVKDSPGFATSRLGVILGCEAIRMLETGVASAEDIDAAMELGYRHPMGPLRLTDLVGLDVRLAILEHLHRELGEQFRPPALLRQMVRAGRLGKKVGRGFYEYPADEKK
ncbi:3-hydroxyacyl-CoA dehydrogenase family protein [Sandaracinus amylolyticus]|uniref:3-hydroxybutyryl-CoA dehydrogenase n=1 Tax=Sandaracinus amylolyticus TaxID=927083 RepID=A0A0F6SEE7_9BACT|nr:3-hydroxyacyl-CoA dehydrogenase NAD-binding domain-containing protein [Sandaracinus amylolyticus]AKF05064.1 3-hydroxybutyryl-CoA dehydrogenase [Sandaracinus amylolyticus]